MNEIDFDAKLRADGYTEIETQDLQSRPPELPRALLNFVKRALP